MLADELRGRFMEATLTARIHLPVIAAIQALRRGDAVRVIEVLDPVSGRHDKAALYERTSAGAGMSLDGPALIVEDGTTTVVPQGFSARINALGQIVLEDRA